MKPLLPEVESELSIAKQQSHGLTTIGSHISTVFVAETDLPTALGTFKLRAYRSQGQLGVSEPIALVYGRVYGKENIAVRVHDQCVTSEVFGSLKCDCKQQLEVAKEYIVQHDGVVIYMPQEGRGIGLANKIRAYELQDSAGVDTVDANRMLGYEDDYRSYEPVEAILRDLGIGSIQLLTNNPRKMHELCRLKVTITNRIPIVIRPGVFNKEYLQAKATRMQHKLEDSCTK